MTRKEVERIVGIFKNHGIDKETGKRVKENVIHDFFDEIDDLITDSCQKFLQVAQDQLGQIGIKIKAQIS